jgi:hypothetical protein
MLVSGLPHASALNMEAIHSSKTSADFQRTARHYITEDNSLEQPV